MLDSIRRGQRWLTGLLILLVGGIFVFFVNTGSQPGGSDLAGDAIVEIDDLSVDRLDFEIARENQEERLRAALGDDYDARRSRDYLDQQTLRSLVQQALLVHGASELGLRTTRQEIQDFLRQSPNFRNAEGAFDQERVIDAIERQFGTQRLFLETIEREFQAQKMIGLLRASAHVSDAEARDLIRYGSEGVRIAYVALDSASLPAGESVDDETVAAFREANEEALRALYEKRRAEFERPERVHARHLLVAVADGSPAEALDEARARIEAARARIAAGEDFAKVAQEVSEDAGTRASGGDLGFVSRDDVDPALAAAAFALEPGEVSDVVETPNGLHLVTVEEKRPGGEPAFEEVADALARELATKEAAEQRAEKLADALSQAIRAGASLEDAARAQGLTLVRTALLRRRPDGYIPDLGAAPDLLATAFALEPGESSPRVFSVGDERVLVQVLERESPSDAEVEAALASAREQLREGKRNALVQTWIDVEEARLSEAGRLRIDSTFLTGTGGS